MSHSAERSEKNCLNCGSELYGRYCHKCGQENIEPRETVWGLVNHFFSDITHFDGKFFATSKYLIARPGFLAREFISGRRARYLHPIRMYVFSSAVFFLIVYSLFSFNGLKLKESDRKAIAEAKQTALQGAETKEDSAAIERTYSFAEKARNTSIIDIGDDEKDSLKKQNKSDNFESIAEYDSAQAALPANQRDGWVSRSVSHRLIVLNSRYRENKNEFIREMIEKFLHSLPYMLFVSLPLYAFFLWLLYIRRKRFYYVDHVIFLIYLYIYTFLILLVFFSLTKVNNGLNSGWIYLLECLLLSWGVYYAWRGMHKFYGQGKGKTLVKFILFNIATSITVIILFTLFLIITALRV